jgi:hypothetical protein
MRLSVSRKIAKAAMGIRIGTAELMIRLLIAVVLLRPTY